MVRSHRANFTYDEDESLPRRIERNSVSFTAPADDRLKTEQSFRSDESRSLLQGWRLLFTSVMGRLYPVTPPDDGDDHWLAEMTLIGEQLRRCAREI